MAKPSAGKEKPKKPDEKAKKSADEELRHIVRILNTDLAGKRQVHMALTGIKGVGRRAASIFTAKAGVDPYATLGLLPDAEIDKLKKVIEEDAAKVLPVWMLNQRTHWSNRGREPQGGSTSRSTGCNQGVGGRRWDIQARAASCMSGPALPGRLSASPERWK